MTNEATKREPAPPSTDEVLQRMLSTPHKPHKTKAQKKAKRRSK